MQLEASLFLEETKLQFIHKKSMSSNDFAKLYEVQKGRVAAMKDELEFFKQQYEKIGNDRLVDESGVR